MIEEDRRRGESLLETGTPGNPRSAGRGVVVRQPDGRQWQIDWEEWRSAVFGFADEVAEFYAASSPKQPQSPEDHQGFQKFAKEWARRRGRPLVK